MSKKFEFERGKQNSDFERRWLAKLSGCLDEAVGEEARRRVMEGSDGRSSGSTKQEVIDWTRGAVSRLEALAGEEKAGEVLTGCACQYPKQRLDSIREKCAETHDLGLVHGMLQEQFLSTTKDFLKLTDDQLKDVVRRGWGVAGVRKGNMIVATKMPYEFHEYWKASTPEERRYRYCHCHRVRESIMEGGEPIPVTYCYCGAGFYKGIWEYILQRPVRVEVLESVLKGDDVCRIIVHLPEDA
jgi:hypothetical protein